MDPYASHVLRALLILLLPSASPPSSPSATPNAHASSNRSKKSAVFKARQAPMKSVFQDTTDENGSGVAPGSSKTSPKEFRQAAEKIVRLVRETLNANEVRALASDKRASPVLQVSKSPVHCCF